jgi:hypothetical protein
MPIDRSSAASIGVILSKPIVPARPSDQDVRPVAVVRTRNVRTAAASSAQAVKRTVSPRI